MPVRAELIAECKARGLHGYSGLAKAEIEALLAGNTIAAASYVTQPMLTCIGNKRKLVSNIYTVAQEVAATLGKDRLVIVDGFAGSTVVSRQLRSLASTLYVNDAEMYSYLMAKCYLEPPATPEDADRVRTHIEEMNRLAATAAAAAAHVQLGPITRLYAPADTAAPREGERCFYTRENALRIDAMRQYIRDHVEPHLQAYCLAPLLVRASIHANTAGVFKGFYKKDGVGCFGGREQNALSRILKPIEVDMPIWAATGADPTQVHCTHTDISALIQDLPTGIDLIYLDPPYNQHPYGSNYFMLNVIATGEEPADISPVSGIPAGWQKSVYNTRSLAVPAMKDLVERGLSKASYLLISYGSEGIITGADWDSILEGRQVRKIEIVYDTYKGSRNLAARAKKVLEIMYLVSAPAPAVTPES
jgi:adenine-specific DNA-methyltransferase